MTCRNPHCRLAPDDFVDEGFCFRCSMCGVPDLMAELAAAKADAARWRHLSDFVDCAIIAGRSFYKITMELGPTRANTFDGAVDEAMEEQAERERL